jgi:DNA gyrase/topoisomerase IV subunit A
MATRNKKLVVKKADANINEVMLGDFAHMCLTEYAKETIFNRAVPELYDGLKPVHRRILLDMYRMGLYPERDTVKAARVVGSVMGNLHAHGDASIMGAVETMVNSSAAQVIGVGNWGSIQQPGAGAMRYVNCKLSPYGMSFLDKDYLAVTAMKPNYDGKDTEAIVLPALLPNLFLNGSEGIAVGFTCGIPPLQPVPLLSLTQKFLSKVKPTPLEAAKTVQPNYNTGGVLYTFDKEARDAWLQWWKTGKSSVYIGPKYTFDTKLNILSVTGFAPNITNEKSVRESNGNTTKMGYLEYLILTLNNDPRVEYAQDMTDANSKVACELHVKLKSKRDQQQTVDDLIDEYFYHLKHFVTTVIEQKQETVERAEDVTVDFLVEQSPYVLLERWCTLRVELETKCLTYRLEQNAKKVRNTEVLILACINRDVIKQVLDSDKGDLDEILSKKLKITLAEAKQVLDLPIRRLSAMDQIKLKQQLAEQNKISVQLKAWLKNPEAKVVADLEKAKELFA